MKQVQELVNNVNKDNILLALEYYDKDVEKTIQAFLDGKNNVRERLVLLVI